jgi:hypothetical protein
MKDMCNYYENKLLREYTKEKPNDQEIEHIVQEYTQARIRDCMLKPEFASALKTSDAQVYMQMLRE